MADPFFSVGGGGSLVFVEEDGTALTLPQSRAYQTAASKLDPLPLPERVAQLRLLCRPGELIAPGLKAAGIEAVPARGGRTVRLIREGFSLTDYTTTVLGELVLREQPLEPLARFLQKLREGKNYLTQFPEESPNESPRYQRLLEELLVRRKDAPMRITESGDVHLATCDYSTDEDTRLQRKMTKATVVARAAGDWGQCIVSVTCDPAKIRWVDNKATWTITLKRFELLEKATAREARRHVAVDRLRASTLFVSDDGQHPVAQCLEVGYDDVERQMLRHGVRFV